MPLPLATPPETVISQPADAALDAFEATLRRHDSATLALEQWCAARGIAHDPRVTAQVVKDGQDPPPAEAAGLLAAGQHDAIAMRNVRLSCGATVLSVAWNWYLPARLTPEMNTALRTGDTPFGKVVAPLGFRRQPLEVRRGSDGTCPAGTISTHRAMLFLPDGRPLAYLIECYTAANLAPPP